MKNDNELLKLAAKAVQADYEINPNGDFELITPIGGVTGYWNPLTKDGDALRLMSALPMGVKFVLVQQMKGDEYVEVNVGHGSEGNIYTQEHLTGDVMAVIRRAIVCAAAKLGQEERYADD